MSKTLEELGYEKSAYSKSTDFVKDVDEVVTAISFDLNNGVLKIDCEDYRRNVPHSVLFNMEELKAIYKYKWCEEQGWI